MRPHKIGENVRVTKVKKKKYIQIKRIETGSNVSLKLMKSARRLAP